MKLCECGCGGYVKMSKVTDKRRGSVKGQPLRFIHGHNWKNKKREPFTDEHLKKMSEAKKGKSLSIEHIKKISGKNNHLYGKKRPKAHCEKISKGRIGIVFTDEHKKNMSISHKGKILSDDTKQKLSESNKGKKISDEQKELISNSLKGKYTNEKSWNWKGGNKISKQMAYKKASLNPVYKLNSNISRSLWGVLKGEKKNRHWETLVNFTLNELKHHLENKFQPGMSWGNYGEWHIDHKIPIAAHNFTKPEHEDFKKCWALDNLQPMWALDNILKGTKINKPFQRSLAM